MYRADVYFLCKTIAEAPIFLAVPLIFTIIAYPMIGLYPNIKHFFIAAGIVALVANVATSFGKHITIFTKSYIVPILNDKLFWSLTEELWES